MNGYALATATSTANGDIVHFQGYNADGTQNSFNFSISPDVSAHSGAIAHITQDVIPSIGEFSGQTVQALQFVQASSTNPNALGVA